MMIRKCCWLVTATVLIAAAAAQAREAQLLNDGWEFALENADGQIEADAWQDVDLPHTWNVADSRDKARPYYRGVGSYRRALYVDEAYAGKRLVLYFEGANQVSELRVNGEDVARHVGGYTAFTADISDHLDYGAANRLELSVDNRHDQAIPPLNADFTFYGGIYRDLHLLVLEPAHFAIDEYAAHGVTVTTPFVSDQRAEIETTATVANETADPVALEVEVELLAPDGLSLARHAVSVEIAGNGGRTVSLPEFEIDAPRLWSPEDPQLYRVVTRLRQGGRLVDELARPVGLRWFEIDAKTGLQLNGRPYRLFGTNRHQDYAGLGNALPDALHVRDLELVKADGFNFLRLAHYPQDPAVLDAADRLGLILWEEIPIVNLIDTGAAFRENSERMLREMIRQHRHHPSILFWGYMNEVTLVEPNPLPEGYYNDVVALARQLDSVAQSEDPSRPTVMALSRDEMARDDIASDAALPGVPDVLAFNLYFGWYYEDFDAFGRFLDDYRQAHPDRPLMVSEYGAGSDERVHAVDGGERFDFSTEYQRQYHVQSFRQLLARPWLVGSAVWIHFDFGSNFRQDTKFAINQKGLRYFDRSAKDIAWYYRAHLVDDPVAHIAVRDWPRRAGSRGSDATMPVSVHTNHPSAELELNGESLGLRSVVNASATWFVPLRDGRNELHLRAGTAEDRAVVHYDDRSDLFRGRWLPGDRLAVNAGGVEQYVAAAGPAWEGDRQYRAGSWGHRGGDTRRSHRRILDSDDDPLYQSQRHGDFTYRFDVPEGHYRVTLGYAALDEDELGSTSQLTVNGLPVSVRSPAPFTVGRADVLTAARGGGGIVIRSADAQASVAAILIRPATDRQPGM